MLEIGRAKTDERVEVGRVVAGVEPSQRARALEEQLHRGALVRIERRPDLEHLAAPARKEPGGPRPLRSEEHTSELQSRQYLVCRLLLEKKKKTTSIYL